MAFLWSEVRIDIIGSVNYSFKTGMLSISQKRSIISLIPMKDKDKSLLKKLRPISLLNINCKILIKAISKWLEKGPLKVMDPNQIDNIKGRFIGENIRLIQDVSHERRGKTRYCYFLRLSKDVWDYLEVALKRFNFGPDILSWFVWGAVCIFII